MIIFLPWIIQKQKVGALAGRGGGGGSVGITILEGQNSPGMKSPQPPFAKGGQGGILGTGFGTGIQGTGSGEQGSDSLLALIRSRIEQNKRYPQIAKQMGVEGRVLIRFEMEPQGNLKEVSLVTSSGSKILDEEALQTIQRAAPFPFYPKPLEVWIRYDQTSH